MRMIFLDFLIAEVIFSFRKNEYRNVIWFVYLCCYMLQDGYDESSDSIRFPYSYNLFLYSLSLARMIGIYVVRYPRFIDFSIFDHIYP